MNKKFFARTALAASGSLLALVGGEQAYGQTEGATRASAVGELVVTARKRAENLQQVPVTVTALSSESIETLGVKNIFDLAKVTPGLYFGTTGGRNGGNKLQIRNFSTGTAGGSKASAFLDGVYMSGDFASTPLANLERIEVLKGPQSATYGRATFVGAVNFVTKDPTGELTGSLEASGASAGEHDVQGTISFPIVPELLAGQFTFRDYGYEGDPDWLNQDGYHFGDEATRAGSAKVVFTPTDTLKVKLFGQYVQDNDHIPAVYFNDLSKRNLTISRPGGTFGYYYNGEVTTEFGPLANGARRWNQAIYGVLNRPGIQREQQRYAASFDWDVAGHTVSGFYAKNREVMKEQIDSNYLGFGSVIAPNAFNVPTTYSYGQISYAYRIESTDDQAEIRVLSPQDQRFRYTFGVNYSKIQGHTELDSLNLTATGARAANFGAKIFNSSAWSGSFQNPAMDRSVFGGVYFDITDQLTVSAEVRVQREDIKINNYLTPTADRRGSFDSTLPRLNVQYKATDDLQFYAVYAEGNNPGGFNAAIPASFLPPGVPVAFPEEKLKNYEAGMKSLWLDGRLLFNLAVYHMDWTNQQVGQTYVTNFAFAGSVNTLTTGTASSKVNGFEAELEGVVSDDLRVRGTVGYGKAEYKSFCSAPYAALTGIQDALGCRYVNGKQQEGTPALQTSLSGAYNHPVFGNWNGFVNADWNYQSKTYLDEFDLAWIPDIHTINMRAGIENGAWTLELFGKNLTDDETGPRTTRVTDPRVGVGGGYPAINGVAQSAAGQQNWASTAKKPRQIGVRAGYKF